MQIYYSGALNHKDSQRDPSLSLGGFESSSLVPNDVLNNIFPTITRDSINQKLKETRMIVLHNPTNQPLLNVKIWTRCEKFTKVSLAAVLPYSLSEGVEVFEKIDNPHSSPYQAILSFHEGEDNSLLIGDFPSKGSIGLWLQREYLYNNLTSYDKGITPDLSKENEANAYIEELSSSEVEEDEIGIFFSWE